LGRVGVATAAAILAQGGVTLGLRLVSATDRPHAVLLVNVTFLAACAILVRLFRVSSEDIGLKILPSHLKRHAVLGTVTLILYLAFCVLGVRISGLRPITSATVWSLLGCLVVAIAEEVYFRGILYRLLSWRYSGRTAVLGSSLLFAAFHLRQGPAALLRLPTGLLWGSIRYSTGMIFLLVFPVHFAYNAVWLLFQGGWDNPPSWAVVLPLAELALGAALTLRRSPFLQPAKKGSQSA
jgi:membrane protease YdiL (CAAX protease family)